VFSVNKDLIRAINTAAKNGESLERFKGQSTLTLIQSISTIPNAFPKKLNTCGRLCLHKSGRFVLVSNRGHQSIAIMRIKDQGANNGQLSNVGYFHTRGETPRHFKFDNSGQYLIVANQDSDNLSIFNFNQSSGEIKFTGNEYRVPSPNFVCCCKLHDDEADSTHSSQASAISDPMSLTEESTFTVDSKRTLQASEISNPTSLAEESTFTVDSKRKLEDDLARALAEVERLKIHISMFRAES